MRTSFRPQYAAAFILLIATVIVFVPWDAEAQPAQADDEPMLMELDDATMLELIEQYMPTAAEQTELWLASIDPSTIQARCRSQKFV